MGVGGATILAVAVFSVLFWLANRFNDFEIRRTQARADVALVLAQLKDAREQGGVVIVEVRGQPIRVRPERRATGLGLAIRCGVTHGRLAPFRASDHTIAASIAALGIPAESVEALEIARSRRGAHAVRVACDGRAIEVDAESDYAVEALVMLAEAIGSAPARALARLPASWEGDGDDRERVLEDGTRVSVRVDGGYVLSRDGPAPRDLGETPATLEVAIGRLATHPRGPELASLAAGLKGVIRAGDAHVTLTLPLATPPEDVERAGWLLGRLSDPGPAQDAYR